jgi:aldose 1-epimerase
MAAPPPSGEQIELALGDQRAVVTEVGAGLRTYAADGRELLDGYSADAMATSGRGQLLLPWPNRIQDGSYELDGRRHQLPLNEPVRKNAIHGLVRWSSWRVAERAADGVVLRHVLHPQPGYPFMLELQVEYALSATGLTVAVSATNVGVDVAPYGAGAHPYLAVGPGGVDEASLRVAASTVLQADDRGIPVGSTPVEDVALDFRHGRLIGSAQLDHCFTDLDRDDDGLVCVHLDGTTLWADESYPYLMVFTGDGLPDASRRSVAVEPMTCAPNAFRSGEGLTRLEPGQTHRARWGISALPA